jgi:endonuclease III
MALTPLQKVLAALRKRYGTPKAHPAGRDPLALIVWEIVAYLADDETRGKAFTALRERVGLAPAALRAAPLAVLSSICRSGGSVEPERRAQRIKEAATLVLDQFGGNLSQVLTWEHARARKALQRFPSVGEPGADRILMICGSHAVLGLDSNGLRTLYRLGYGQESKNYTRTYRESRDAAQAELPKSAKPIVEASALLRTHGQETCKYTVPRCEECVVTGACNWFKEHTR